MDGWRERVALPESAGRSEALLSLARSVVLLFGAATMAAAGVDGPYPLLHLGGALLSAAAAPALWRLGPRAARRAAVTSTVVDLALVAAYSAAAVGRPGVGSAYLAFALVSGPVRWGLPGAVLTGLPVLLVASTWPVPDASGSPPPQGWVLAGLILLLVVPTGFLSAVWRRSGARLRQAQGQFEAAFAHASIGMALLDDAHRVEQANASLGELLGTSAERLRGTELHSWCTAQDRSVLLAALDGLSGSAPATRTEVRFLGPDGQDRWGLVAASRLAGAPGVPSRTVLQVENVTERRSAQDRLSHQASHDALTGLPNRVLMMTHLERALTAGERLCVVFLDLDRFKVVNDGLGHAAGDRLLVAVAARLQAVLRPGDVVARLGGDEFVVLCHGVGAETEALVVGERVLDSLRGPVRLDARSEVVPAGSAGVALATPGATPETLLRDADTAMYQAKAAGGGRACLFTVDQHRAARYAHELEVDLRRALAEGRLEVHYQPVVDLAVGRVGGAEALVRWFDEERGTVPPAEFIAVAEQSSLIDELGAWVLDVALAEAAGWTDLQDPVPGIAVNVSPRQLQSPGFAGRVGELLRRHGVVPGRLTLELTETALVRDTAELVPALQELRAVGVRLAIDDFGTGHASLTYLASLPVDVVKVDPSFVTGVADDAGSTAIVGAVVAMAGAFGLTVVAEGVETEAQLAALRRLGVERVQGYLLSPAVRPEQLRAALTTGRPERIPQPRSATPVPTGTIDAGQRLRVLVEASRDVTACVDLDAVFSTSLDALARVVRFTGGSIQLVDGDVIRLAAASPPPPPDAFAASLPLGQGVSGGVAATGEPRYLPDITIAAAVAPQATRRTSTGVRSWYGVPLIAEGRVIGVLQVDSTTVDAFDSTDRLLVLAFAPVVAAAVQTARLFGRQLDALQHPEL